jgi:hypothetical protein
MPCVESAPPVEGIIVPTIGHGGTVVADGTVAVAAAPSRPAIRSRIRCAIDWILAATPEARSIVRAVDAWPLSIMVPVWPPCIIAQPVWSVLVPVMLPVCA